MLIPKAIKDNVIICIRSFDDVPQDKITAGGIIIPAAVEEHQMKVTKHKMPSGTVVSIGPDVTEVKEGDKVAYNKHGAKGLGPGYEDYISININEVLAVISSEE